MTAPGRQRGRCLKSEPHPTRPRRSGPRGWESAREKGPRSQRPELGREQMNGRRPVLSSVAVPHAQGPMAVTAEAARCPPEGPDSEILRMTIMP